MYPNHIHQHQSSPFRLLAVAITNDVYYTYANLVFSTQSVGFACAIFAAQVYNLPLIFKEENEIEEQQVFSQNSPETDQDQNEEEIAYTKLVRNPSFDWRNIERDWCQKNGGKKP